MITLARAVLLSFALAWTQASAFDFAISNFKVVRNGQTIFEDTFSATTPPAAPNFRSGASASYVVPAGSFSPAVGGKLRLNSAAATISPAVSSALGVVARLRTNTDPTTTDGLKPGTTFEISAVFDATAPGPAGGEGYAIELGDWLDRACTCLRVGVQRQAGNAVIRFWRVNIGNDTVENHTTISSVPFEPGSNTRILLKLSKSSATSNAVRASYAWVNDGVAGADIPLNGTADLFTDRQYAVAMFKAFSPVAYSVLQGTNRSLSLTGSINVAGTHIGQTGNIYVAALYQGLVFFNDGAGWVAWRSGNFPAYASNVTLTDRSVNVLSNVDVSQLVGAVLLVGYGRDQRDMLESQAYNIIHTVE